MHNCFQMPSMVHGTLHNQSSRAFEAFDNNHAAAQALLQQEAGARYNHEIFPWIQNQIQPSHWPATIQSIIQTSNPQLPINFNSDYARMNRNGQRRQNRRDQNDLSLHQIGQVLVELLSSLGDRGYRGLNFPGRSTMEPNYADFLDHQHWQPRRNLATADDGPEYQALRPTGRNHHVRMNTAGHGKHGEPIGKAMKKLFKLLGDAEKTYGEFQEGFDGDTNSIKRYARTTSLTDLWRRKFEGEKGDVTDEDAGEQSEDFAETHDTMKKKLAAAMDTAISATAGELHGASAAVRLENVGRLQQKVETANMHIMEVMEMMPRNREYCVALLTEVAALKAIIDPDSEPNKKLYQAGPGEGQGDGEDDDEARVGGGNWEN